VKPTIDRAWDEADDAAEPRDAQDQQDHAGHERGGLQAARCRIAR
jgi:hypothetical protein